MINRARIGVCNWCRAVKGFDTKQTQFHHEQYDMDNPEKYIIELCAECHKKEGIKQMDPIRIKEISRMGGVACHAGK